MTTSELLEALRNHGVAVEANGGYLDLDAPAGALTNDLLEAVTKHKPRLLKLLEWERRKLKKADRRGLIIERAKDPGWILLHDPTTGEWHEVRAEECLPGVVETAGKYRRKGEAT
jgi:hypothetical protein